VALSSILWAVEQPPGARILPAVPTAPLGEHLDLTMTVTAPGEATIDPWPLATPELELELPARTLPATPLAEPDARAAFHAAALEPVRWRLASWSTSG
jgi:hypothetical protein